MHETRSSVDNFESSRRDLLRSAAFLGAALLLPSSVAIAARSAREDRERFSLGVASGDPAEDSVVLWTRYDAPARTDHADLTVELSYDENFTALVAQRRITALAASDFCCRVLAAGLSPATTYWFRFIDTDGRSSRTGRTRTAPRRNDKVRARFAFVSCQNVTMGPLLAWRRMLHEDLAAGPLDQIDFVLNLGDFVYETVWYPEDRPTYFDRKINGKVRFPTGERHEDYHVPVNLADYRQLYRSYLLDPDLQAARARWPFVSIWDNGEFSDKGWQSLQRFGTSTIAAQTRKVAANQAWFEYIPSRAGHAGGNHFAAPNVSDRPVTTFDANGLGIEPDNIRAVTSLIGYRNLRWGKNVDLILTDQRSFRSDDFTNSPAAKLLTDAAFPQMIPFETLEALDAGATAANGAPPEKLATATGQTPNFQRHRHPRTLLGTRQKHWFLTRLAASSATWKIWGNSVATLDMRADPQNLPPAQGPQWRGKGFAGFGRNDFSTAYAERREIYDFVRAKRISNFVTLSGDRHSFWAGYAAASLPPSAFSPVGISFVTGSITSPGMAEAFEHLLPATHPLRPLFLVDRAGGKLEPSMNLLLKHGVRSCLEYARTGDLAAAHRASNPDNAPHVNFVDMAGHGYGVVTASADQLLVDFVGLERPIGDDGAPDGGPLRYRVRHAVPPFDPDHRPRLSMHVIEGEPGLSA